MSEIVIREGFLCPICMHDLQNVSQLQQHFEENHSEDKDVLHQLKDLFGKAKKKILGLDEEDSGSVLKNSTDEYSSMLPAASNAESPGFDSSLWEPQKLGKVRNHTDTFKAVRDSRIDRYVVETNKLLIRLDKLMSPEVPTDPKHRKIYEMRIVNWAPDGDVNLCPSCGDKFRITKRRHHCRLCGGIMCSRCSQFLPYTFAKKLTDPAFNLSDGDMGFLRRTGSSSSLNSMVNPEGEPHIRTCIDCRRLLERRDMLVQQRNCRPFIVQLYEKMRDIIQEAERQHPEYQKMAESLMAGETTYSLQKANEDRRRLLKLYDNVDILSKRISTLGLDNEDKPQPKELQLQKSIRSYAMQYLHMNMLGLINLPSESELKKRQEQRDLEIKQRIEHQLALERELEERKQYALQKPKLSLPMDNKSSQQSEVVRNSGWTPFDVGHKVSENEDPMIQQMNIIREYIRQAKQAHKFDEVRILEDNLKDLQKEYYKQMGHSFEASTS